MSESADGLMLPASRQNDTRLGIARPPGGVNEPAGTSSAVAMVVCGISSEARLPHVAAAAGRAAQRTSRKRITVLLYLSAAISVQPARATDKIPGGQRGRG